MTAALRRLWSGAPPRLERRAPARALDVGERLSSPRIALVWLVRMRWHLAAAQALAVWVAAACSLLVAPGVLLWALIAALGLSNLALSGWARSGRALSLNGLGAVLLADTALLTAALALAGGADNPLVALYVVEVTLAALLLDKRWLGALIVASLLGHGALSSLPVVPLAYVPPRAASLGLLGLVAAFNGVLVARVVAAFRARQAELSKAQRQAARAEKLASLTTLAAGAAHELATPLATIAVAATELEALINLSPSEAAIEAKLIRQQVERCKHILRRMGARGGSALGELPRRISGREVFELVRRELGASAGRLQTEGDEELELEAPGESLAAVLANLVTNGLQASPAQAPVELALQVSGSRVRFTVSDRGAGIAASLLPRLGEPFFTTKAPGQGLGLGLFLAFRFCEACQGELDISSVEGAGTHLRLELPRWVSAT